MNLTTEQIEQILAGAPEGVNQYEECGKYWYVCEASDIYLESEIHHLGDLRAILEKEKENKELRQRIEQLEAELSMKTCELDKALGTDDNDFYDAVKDLPPNHWSKYDISAVRIGWEMAKSKLEAERGEFAATIDRCREIINRDHSTTRFHEICEVINSSAELNLNSQKWFVANSAYNTAYSIGFIDAMDARIENLQKANETNRAKDILMERLSVLSSKKSVQFCNTLYGTKD